MFTTQHYVKVAEVLKKTELTAGHGEYASCEIAREQMMRAFSALFANDNERFNSDQFLKYCGLEKTP